MAKVKTLERLSISVRGVVQGVGFRPFVYQLATKYNLSGWVCNTSEDVKIEVEGNKTSLDRFRASLVTGAPPLAHIEGVSASWQPPAGYTRFEIRHSIAEEGKYQLVSPDIATCEACQRELLKTGDRRFRYPFTNCTNCGPRFTIIEDIPYDRPKTTMRRFVMCLECEKEYNNPLDRRFHAQPNACPRCGPHLELTNGEGKPIECADIITVASELLRQGKILAIKGLGGFLLACDATSSTTVQLLRQRKRRPSKPLAIMVATLEEAKQNCHVSKEEEKLLLSPQCPIVLLLWKPESTVSSLVAPNLKYLGVMLPYTPLHHILLRETGLPLVMTSGNLTEEPIAKDNDEAVRRLRGIADYFIIHNRDIYARYDDTVAIVERNQTQLMRRARGYAPYPIHLPFMTRQILACGAQEKNAFCFTKDNYAFVSQHVGDMENWETVEHFRNTIELYKGLFRIEPEIIACDLHPDYLSTKYAEEIATKYGEMKLVRVQHHHAHIASCIAENGVNSPVIGVAFDGTGYGSDGNIWGGEFLVADSHCFHRVGHVEYLPLAGGEAAIKRPYRAAISYLLILMGENSWRDLPFLKQIDEQEIELVSRQVQRKLNSPLTSSMGRLFDVVSALIGVRGEIEYEAQAAIELEMIAYSEAIGLGRGNYPFSITEQDGMEIIHLSQLLTAIISDLQKGVPKTRISAKFHHTVAEMVSQMCRQISKQWDITQVALSGGVFQNRLLLRKVIAALEKAGFSLLTHHQVPCNDGGISLGQAVIANSVANLTKADR